jgi:hypothetical protein
LTPVAASSASSAGRQGQEEEGVSVLMSDAEPRYMGGQAVLEGVMMRGASTWAVAVRDPEGNIKVDVRDVPGWAERYRNIPMVRGVMGLGESLGLGYRALTWSANQQVPEEEPSLREGAGLGNPRCGRVLQLDLHRDSGASRASARELVPRIVPLVEGIVRLALFIVYLSAIGLLKDIRRVFQYHGAEHKAIAAYENDVELTPEVGAAIHDRARPLRHELLADRHGHRDPRVFGDSAAQHRLRDRVPRRARSGDRGH